MSPLSSLAILALDPSAQVTDQPASSPPTVAVAPAEAKQDDDRLDRAAQLVKEGKPADALPYLDSMIAEFEKAHAANSESMVFSASNLAQSIYYAGITATLKKSGVVVDRDWGYAYFLKGYALIDLNRSDEALAYLDKAVALSPANSQFLAERAEWHKSRRDWEKAFKDFEGARTWVSLADDNVKVDWEGRAIRGMAFVRIEQGKLDEAERLLGEALKLNQNDSRAREELELIASMRKR